MSTQEQRDAVRAARAAAGEAYAAAVAALTTAYVELAALDVVCSNAVYMSDNPGPPPQHPPIPTFRGWVAVGDPLYIVHDQYAPTQPDGAVIKNQIADRVQEIFDDDLS